MIYYLNEASINDYVGKITSKAAIIYEHMLKWKHWESELERCSNTWCNSIFESIYEIQKIINKSTNNVPNRANEKIYEEGYKKAITTIKNDKKIPSNIKTIISNDNNEVFEDFETVDKIIDKNKVKEWLLEHSKSNYANGSVDHFYNKDYSEDDKDNSELKNKIEKAKNKGKNKSRKFLDDEI